MIFHILQYISTGIIVFDIILDEISHGVELFKLVMYGPILVTIGILGMFGNVLSIIVFTRSSMKKSAINAILIGKVE